MTDLKDTCTKTKIIDAGIEAMINKSYNSVGLNEILKSVNVPKGSFYHYFKSKEDLGVSIIEKMSEDRRSYLLQHFKNKEVAPKERLREFFNAQKSCLLESDYKRKCLMAKLALEIGCLSSPMRGAIKIGMDELRTLTSYCIQEAQEKGEVTKDISADLLADYVLSSWEGVMVKAQASHDVRPLDDFMKITFERVLNP